MLSPPCTRISPWPFPPLHLLRCAPSSCDMQAGIVPRVGQTQQKKKKRTVPITQGLGFKCGPCCYFLAGIFLGTQLVAVSASAHYVGPLSNLLVPVPPQSMLVASEADASTHQGIGWCVVLAFTSLQSFFGTQLVGVTASAHYVGPLSNLLVLVPPQSERPPSDNSCGVGLLLCFLCRRLVARNCAQHIPIQCLLHVGR
jgi:hypothetical protein